MAPKLGRMFHFHIPFFRIFYSTTYTTIYIVCICFLGITPVSMMWQAIDNSALQYVVVIGGAVLLTASFAIVIFASRLFTNRTVMAGVGKAYIPVEPDEVGRSIRKMIVSQYERSAMVAWESRPRDLLGEILQAEQLGVLPPETRSVGRNDYTVGREIPIDPSSPPWGDVQHLGWSSPAPRDDNDMPHIQFAPVVEELPNLIEAKAVSLTPADPTAIPADGTQQEDPLVFEALRRPETMGLRDYLTQLSYLGLVNPPQVGQSFLQQYELARFGGLPIDGAEFRELMSTFSDLLSGMTNLDPTVIDEIRTQKQSASDMDEDERLPKTANDGTRGVQASPSRSPESSILSPVTARTAPSRDVTPYLQQQVASEESLGSVIHRSSLDNGLQSSPTRRRPSQGSSSLASSGSDSGSVLRHSSSPNTG